MKGLEKTAKVLAALGAVAFGLRVFNFEVMEAVGMSTGAVGKIIFAIVGLSGLWALAKAFK